MQTFKSLELAEKLYHGVRRLRVSLHHQDQLLRAASSVALNLAEGNAKTSVKDKCRFYQISLGSLREVQMILKLERVNDPRVLDDLDHLGACIYKLTRQPQ